MLGGVDFLFGAWYFIKDIEKGMSIMLDTFLATVSSMMVMFICILVGFILRKCKAAPENTGTVLSKLVMSVFLPAQALDAFMRNCTFESIASQYQVVLYGAVAIVISLVIGIPLSCLFAKDRDQRSIYRYSLVFANFGYLGNAIVPLVMGEEMLYSYILFTLPLYVVLYAWGVNSLTPKGKGNKTGLLKSLLKPPVVSLIIGMVLGLSGVSRVVPDFVSSALSSLAGCMGPVAMLLTGFIVGGYEIGKILKNGKVYIATILRLAVLPAVIAAALYVLGADKNTVILAAIGFGAALGLNTVVVPAAYDGDTHTGAAMALVSHLSAVVTIPLMYALLNWVL